MSKLLINGCSYAIAWNETCNELGSSLGFDNTVNIAHTGSSNSRIFRTTLDYILENSVDFVILSLTYWDRQEALWGVNKQWVDYSPNGIMKESAELQYPPEMYQGYIKNRFKFDIGTEYIEKLLNDIITFSGWLDHMNIRYLIFSAPDDNFKHENYNLDKLKYINKNNRIIDIKDWSSNQYMFDNGGHSPDFTLGCVPGQLHFDGKSYKILNNFLYDYIIKHQL